MASKWAEAGQTGAKGAGWGGHHGAGRGGQQMPETLGGGEGARMGGHRHQAASRSH